MRFAENLEAAVNKSSLLCVGPDLALMAIDDVAAFNGAVIEASDLVCAYKPRGSAGARRGRG